MNWKRVILAVGILLLVPVSFVVQGCGKVGQGSVPDDFSTLVKKGGDIKFTDSVWYKIVATSKYRVVSVDTTSWDEMRSWDGEIYDWEINGAQIEIRGGRGLSKIGRWAVVLTYDNPTVTYDTICYKRGECD